MACTFYSKLMIVNADKQMQIKPLIGPTRQIMKIGVKEYDWHELFPKGNAHFFLYNLNKELKLNFFDMNKYNKIIWSSNAVKSNAGAIVAIWSPIILVSFY